MKAFNKITWPTEGKESHWFCETRLNNIKNQQQNNCMEDNIASGQCPV